MKQIFFLFFCVLITTGLQAQITPQDTIIVTGQVTGSNGQVYPNAMVEIEWWHNNYFDYAQVSTNSNGIYEYSIPSNSTPEYGINASFHCLLDTNFIVSDYLLQNELVAGFNYIDLETYSCTDSITQDTCFMTLSSQMGASDFLWTFTADPGNIDISGYYDWYLPQGVEFVNPSQSNSSEVDLIFDNGGSYEVSVYLRDTITDEELCFVYTNIQIEEECEIGFIQNDSIGSTILESWVQSGTAPYSYNWEVDGNTVFNSIFIHNDILDMEDYNDGTYNVCLQITDANNFVCEYCDTVIIETPPVDSCWIQVDSFNLVCNDNGTPDNPLDDFTDAYIIVNTNVDQYYVRFPDPTDPCNGISSPVIGPLTPGEPYKVKSNIRNEYTRTINISNEPFAWNSDCSINYNIEATNICAAATDTCIMSLFYDRGVTDSWWTFTANSGYVDAPNSIYEWYLPQGASFANPNQTNDEVVDINFDSLGTYFVCVSLVDTITGSTLCEECIEVEYGTENCWIGFDEVLDTITGETNFNAWVQKGAVSPFIYNWEINGNSVQSGTDDIYEVILIPDTTYNVCLTINGGYNTECTICKDIYIGSEGIICYGELLIHPNENTTILFGNPAIIVQRQCIPVGPVDEHIYEWYVDGSPVSSSTGDELDMEGYPSGTYTVCLDRTDPFTGNTCHYCTSITIDEPNTCLNPSVINLPNAPCNFNYDPVCGCDGVTYTNACVAYFCFGVTEWTAGECGTTTPIDTCETTAEFFYYAQASSSGIGYDAHFFGYGENADDFVWTFGDGASTTGQEQDYVFSNTDSIQAYTICLTTITWADSCTSTVCETIVFDSTPNGYISGTVVQGGNLWDGDENIMMRSNSEGDPLEGILIELQDAAGNIIATTTTDITGAYNFGDLQFGDYFVFVNIEGNTHTPYHVKLRPTYQNDDEINFEVRSSEVVGNENISFASDISISPNPSHDFVNLSMSITETTDVNIIITDILGQQIQTQAHTLGTGRENIRLEMQDFPTGIYMISLQANGEVITKKVIKK